jgi:nicotinamidase-related amidase
MTQAKSKPGETVREAIVVTDMLEEFVYGKISSPRAKSVVEPISMLLSSARENQIPVVYVCDAHFESDPEIVLWGRHAMKGEPGSQIIKKLRPEKTDYVLEKHVYSAFHETGLELLLRDLGVDTVVIVGLLTEICVRHTAADAFMRGFNIRIPKDCVEALTESNQNEGLRYLKEMYGAEITTGSNVAREWRT